MMAPAVRDRNLNAFWCAIVIDALVAEGAARAVLCPGGRNAMFNLVAHAEPALASVHGPTDERSAAFLALGMARAGGRPVVLSVTSGSAVGNVVPALMEAHAAHLPLVVVSADRDHSHGTSGAPQTVDQIAACAPFVGRILDLPAPDAGSAALSSLCRQLGQALQGLATAGPIHINLPMPALACPTEIDAAWDAGRARRALERARAPTVPSAAARAPAPAASAQVDRLHAAAAGKTRVLVVAGESSRRECDAAAGFVRACGLPVLADACSGLRRSAVSDLCLASMDALVLSRGMQALAPELVIRFGRLPLAHTTQQFLAALPAPVVALADKPAATARPARIDLPLEAPMPDRLRAMLGPVDEAWKASLLAADARAMAAARPTDDWCELDVIGHLMDSDAFGLVHLANSLTSRFANLVTRCRAQPQAIHGARGVNGIDGTIAQFFGELLDGETDGLLILGDQAFVYDVPALQLAAAMPRKALIVVLNNFGGGLFDYLPCSTVPGYAAAVRGRAGGSAARVAQGFALQGTCCDSMAGLRAALERYRDGDGVHVIEACFAPPARPERIAARFRAMVAAADAAPIPAPGRERPTARGHLP